MRTLGIHTKYFRFESKEKATQAAESLLSNRHKVSIERECLVIFISVEKEDSASPLLLAAQLAADTLKRAKQLKVRTVILYPYVHLTENPSTSLIFSKVDSLLECLHLSPSFFAFSRYPYPDTCEP